MFADDSALIEAVKQWGERAESDLWIASLALKHAGARHPMDGVCFHAQQCVEKYLKALLTWQGVPFPRTHAIAELIAKLPEPNRPDLTAQDQIVLTRYSTITRYPGDYEPITLTEARRAVTLARRVRRQVRRHLPKEAL
jgi:HEPN domain-containing protein